MILVKLEIEKKIAIKREKRRIKGTHTTTYRQIRPRDNRGKGKQSCPDKGICRMVIQYVLKNRNNLSQLVKPNAFSDIWALNLQTRPEKTPQ